MSEMNDEEIEIYKGIIRGYERLRGKIAPPLISITASLYTVYRVRDNLSHREAVDRISASIGYKLTPDESTLYERMYNANRI